MAQKRVPLSSNVANGEDSRFPKYSVGGKVFLLGEYAVLKGGPALVATVAPRFEAVFSKRDSGSFPGGSPAWRLFEFAQVPIARNLEFSDPWRGAGGWGGSTAEFIFAYLYLARSENWPIECERVWKTYRELSVGQRIPPSGADLIAQWNGGITWFDPRKVHFERIELSDIANDILIFSATGQEGRKVTTHSHLAEISDKDFFTKYSGLLQELESLSQKGKEAWMARDHAGFGNVLTQYAEFLKQAGFECEETSRDREVLSRIPGVLGVKGAGAMQSDAVIVLVNRESTSQVIEVAQARGLKLVCDGIREESGIQCEES